MPSTATNNTVGHVNEIGNRLSAVLDGATTFLPLLASLEREITRVEEDILAMRRSETDEQTLGRIDGMQQRHRSIATAAAELRRQVTHVFVVCDELKTAQQPFLDAVVSAAAKESASAAAPVPT